MNIKRVTLYHVSMNLLSPFVTSLETVQQRETIIVEVEDNDGATGWGEVVAFSSPWYTEETVKTSWHMLEDFLIPKVLAKEIHHPSDVTTLCSSIKRNYMAKAGLETAIWDLFAKKQGVSLSQLIGGTRSTIEVGVAVGARSIDDCLRQIERYVQEGYRRIKIKIKPENDYEWLKEIRRHFPTISLMVDANSAYTLNDLQQLQALDEFQLLMIEQPLAADDIVDHAVLQKQMTTPICLDESIVTCEDARKAIELGSCKVINIKIGRVGGMNEAKKIHDLCQAKGIAVWCGGMLEMGISRAHNIALASLPHFTIPGDISASSRYWEEDIIIPEVVVKNGMVEVPKQAGIGVSIHRKRLEEITLYKRTYTAS
ncbi:o-succinylbenzoate synthase [Thermaerobacillus caldiproteolyticus]|uniref:o-succinylbenzoate synthase n=1 Tax=Thermaerobacillus caldiproteolyticus TaxID=247480 RepID=UPI00188B7AA3|nr:o-succinylbenzoate synthase [Anoxybacillus caldiproteolyticus]QPA33261.1 o-succinylbenzoate synthase [Anoxybacillus caldiproteolyticus]